MSSKHFVALVMSRHSRLTLRNQSFLPGRLLISSHKTTNIYYTDMYTQQKVSEKLSCRLWIRNGFRNDCKSYFILSNVKSHLTIWNLLHTLIILDSNFLSIHTFPDGVMDTAKFVPLVCHLWYKVGERHRDTRKSLQTTLKFYIS